MHLVIWGIDSSDCTIAGPRYKQGNFVGPPIGFHFLDRKRANVKQRPLLNLRTTNTCSIFKRQL